MRLHSSTLQRGRWRAIYTYYDNGTPASLMICEILDDHTEGPKYVTEFMGIQDLIDVLDLLRWQVVTHDVITSTQFQEEGLEPEDDSVPF